VVHVAGGEDGVEQHIRRGLPKRRRLDQAVSEVGDDFGIIDVVAIEEGKHIVTEDSRRRGFVGRRSVLDLCVRRTEA
jgi:hypothetical protein